jgi:hypothetical protein
VIEENGQTKKKEFETVFFAPSLSANFLKKRVNKQVIELENQSYTN